MLMLATEILEASCESLGGQNVTLPLEASQGPGARRRHIERPALARADLTEDAGYGLEVAHVFHLRCADYYQEKSPSG